MREFGAQRRDSRVVGERSASCELIGGWALGHRVDHAVRNRRDHRASGVGCINIGESTSAGHADRGTGCRIASTKRMCRGRSVPLRVYGYAFGERGSVRQRAGDGGLHTQRSRRPLRIRVRGRHVAHEEASWRRAGSSRVYMGRRTSDAHERLTTRRLRSLLPLRVL
jgi:hypothetical protein